MKWGLILPLDAQLAALREQRIRDNAAPLYTMSLADARAADLASIRDAAGEPEKVWEVSDTTLPGPDGDLPVRVYRPGPRRPLPVLAYFFGGGWTLGPIHTPDPISPPLPNPPPCP